MFNYLDKKIDEWANQKWYENPFGSSAQATETHYLELASAARDKSYPEIENFEEYSGYVIFHQGDTRIELPKVKAGRVHFEFLDGAHTYKDVMFEYSQIEKCQSPGDMIVFGDYTPSQFPGSIKAVDKICSTYRYEKMVLDSERGRGYVVARKF